MSYFGPAYSLFYRWLIPREQTAAEVDFLLRRLAPRPHERWLDLPCGYGRHLSELRACRRDLRLVGADLNLDYLREPGLADAARLCRCDMRRLPLADGSCDAVLNLLNSFGYRMDGDDGDDRRMLAEIARVLTPAGRLVIDLPNRRAVLAIVRAEPTVRYCLEGFEALEDFEWDAAGQCLLNRTRWGWPGGHEEASYRLRLYTPAQARELLARAGLTIEAIYGDFRGGPFNPHHSDRMLIFARRA